MAKDMHISVLLDFYGEILTDKQHAMIEHYYNEDLSLGEIAENENISRQGVRDAVKRAEAQLIEMEEKLGYAAKHFELVERIAIIKENASALLEYNEKHTRSFDVDDYTTRILNATEGLV